MTTTTTTTTAVSGSRPTPARTATLAAGGLAVAILIVLAGNLVVHKGEAGGTAPAMTTAIVCLVLTAALFTVVPRLRSARAGQRGTTVFGVLALASLVVFWTGVTPVFAAATLATAERCPHLARTARTLRVLSVIATVLTVGWSVGNSHWF
jgi:hypothetical protein